jgi:hypothetical protein
VLTWPAEGLLVMENISVAAGLNCSRSAHKRQRLHHSKVCYCQSTILMPVTIRLENHPLRVTYVTGGPFTDGNRL